jgi:trans-aconitate methyltransferase
MGSVVSLIALDANDLRIFGEILRYFPIPNNIALNLHYPSSLDEDQLFELPQCGFIPYIGSAPDIASLHPLQTGALPMVFASHKSCAVWMEHNNLALARAWDCPKYALVDLTNIKPSVLLNQRFLNLDKLQVLRSEHLLQQEFPEPRPKRCQSYSSFTRHEDPLQVLATRDQNLLECWLESHAPTAFLWHVGKEATALTLRNPTEDAAFNLAYRQFAAFIGALALLPSDQLITREKVHKMFDSSKGSYGFFAEYYDKYMSHVSYSDWLDMILRWCKKFMDRQPEAVLELACGTANISEQLIYQGFSVDACDLSPFMLHVAERKLFKPKLFRHDMAVPLNITNRYDLILCLFDSINYLLEERAIETMLNSAWQALRAGSLLVFDISTIMNSQTYFADTTQYTTLRDGYMVHRAEFKPHANRQTSRLTLFRKHNDVFHRLEECHTQRVYRLDEVLRLIADTPFDLQGIFSPETRNNLLSRRNSDLDHHYPRLFFVLKK